MLSQKSWMYVSMRMALGWSGFMGSKSGVGREGAAEEESEPESLGGVGERSLFVEYGWYACVRVLCERTTPPCTEPVAGACRWSAGLICDFFLASPWGTTPPVTARLRSAKYRSRSRKRHGMCATLHASHSTSGAVCIHLIFFKRLEANVVNTVMHSKEDER